MAIGLLRLRSSMEPAPIGSAGLTNAV